MDFLTTLNGDLFLAIVEFLPIDSDRLVLRRCSKALLDRPILRRLHFACEKCEECESGQATACALRLRKGSQEFASHLIRLCLPYAEELSLGGLVVKDEETFLSCFQEKGERVRKVDIRGSKGLTDRFLEVLGRSCPSLLSFRSKDALFTDRGITSFVERCPNLLTLDLWGSHMLTDDSLSSISSSLYCLTNLSLVGCHRVTDEGLKAIVAGCTELRALNLRFCHKISDESVLAIARHCRQMRRLNLRYCFKVTDRSVAVLCYQLSSLKALNLSQCPKISDEAVSLISQSLLCLEELSLWGCPKVSSASLLSSAASMRSLRVLDIRARDHYGNLGGCSADQYLNTYRDTLSRWQQHPTKSGVFERRG